MPNQGEHCYNLCLIQAKIVILNNHSLYTFCEKLALKVSFPLAVGSTFLRNTSFPEQKP